ncbi:MAG: ferric iron uptake transcriptional regulator [Pseudomonadota bacterium]
MDNTDIRQAGLKVTLPRLKILEILERNQQRHLSAEDVYRILLENGEEIGLATVYRVLTQFEAAGLVKRQNFEGTTSVFELDSGTHHDHIVCLECGHVEEFVDETIEKSQKRVSKKLGFELAEHSMVLYGRCMNDNCPHRK